MADILDFRVKNGLLVTTTATIEGTTQSTSTSSGALQVLGGAGIAKNLYVGGIFSATGAISSGGNLYINGAASITTTTNAGNTASGALIVTGGAGIGLDLYVGGKIVAGSNTPAISTQSGDLVLAGGAGIGGDLWVNGQGVIQSTTQSTSTNSGALVVSGGVGVGKTLTVGGDLYVGGTLYGAVLGSVTTSTNLALGTTGQIPYQSNVGTTLFFGPGTAGQLLVSAGAAAPVYTNTGSIYVGAAQYSNRLFGGAAGSIPYQSNADITTFLAGGATGSFLKYNGTAPTWATTASFNGGTGSSTAAGGQSVYVGSGGIGVSGHSYFANNVGVGGSMTVGGPTTFNDIVTFAGTATYVYSSNSVLTDSLLVLHANTSGGWTFNDNLDIGMKGDYYDTVLGQAKSFFFGFKPSNRYLEFLVRGVESSPGIFTGDFGDLKLNTILLTSTATSTNSDTGALVVPGGVGIRGSVNLQDTGQLVVGVNLAAPLPDAPINTAGDVDSYFQVNVQNINSGINASSDLVLTADIGNDVQYFTDIGIANSNFAYPDFNIANPLDSYAFANGGEWVLATSNPGKGFKFWTGGTTKPGTVGISTFTNTGTLTVSISSLGMVIYAQTSATSTNTGALQVQGGAGIAGDLRVGGTIYGNAVLSGSVNTATNLGFGTAGQVPYQTAPGLTSFYGPGTSGQILKSNGAAAPSYVDTATVYVGYAVTATNINSGSVAQLVFQSSTGTTGFVGAGTLGQLLVSQGTTSTGPLFVSTASIYVKDSEFTNNLRNGTAGQVPYQSAPNVTAYFGPGTSGQFLQSNGAAAPSYVNTSTMYVGRAVLADSAPNAISANSATTATNLLGGATGSIPYQASTGTTTFLPISTSGFVLISNGTVPTWGAQSGLGAGFSDTIKVTNDTASTATQYLTFVNGSSGYLDLKTAANTGMYYVPSTGVLGIGRSLTIGTSTVVAQRSKVDIYSSGAFQFHQSWFNGGGVLDLTFVSSTWKFGSSSNEAMQFGANGPLAIAGGATNNYVGINTTSPAAWLDVNGGMIIRGLSTVTNTTQATNTTTGALQVKGGVGVGGNIYTAGKVGFVNTSNVSRVYQYYNAVTDSLDTVFE